MAVVLLFNSLIVAYGFWQLDRFGDRFTAAVLMTVPSAVSSELALAAEGPASGQRPSVVFYSDLSCEFCRRSSEVMDSLRMHFGERVEWTYHPLPQPPHIAPASFKSAALLLCSDDRDAGWLALQEAANTPKEASAGLEDLVRTVLIDEGVSARELDRCADSQGAEVRTWNAMFAASRRGVTGVPTTMVDGMLVKGQVEYEVMRDLIESRLAARL